MIILVASVVLGTGVVIYGTSLFQTGAQQQAISTQGIKIWVNATDATGLAWGAAGVRNSGDKLVSVDQIIVRGTSVPFTSWYVDKNQTRVTTDNYQSQFVHTGTGPTSLMKNATLVSTDCSTQGFTAAYLMQDFDGTGAKPTVCLGKASGPTALNPGERLIVYFKVPSGVLSSVDAGSQTSVSIFAGQTGNPTSVTVANP